MIFDLGGIVGEVRNPSALRPAETALLSRFATTRAPDFQLSVETSAVATPAAKGATAISWSGSTAALSHPGFSGSVEVGTRQARFHRLVDEAWPLQLMLRSIAVTLLPFGGWLPLHCAAIRFEDEVLLFLGPSGAGKSTLAATSPWPVLTDEMAVLSLDGSRVLPTIFWGDSLLRPLATSAPLNVQAIMRLDQGPQFSFGRLSAPSATAALVATVLTPIAPVTAVPVMTGIASAATSGRCAAMAWHPSAPPWNLLASTVPNFRRRG